MDAIYKRKPRAPSVNVNFADGTTEKLWCTFGEEQVDLDVTKTATREFIDDTLSDMCDEGASIIRLDAFAYAIKKPAPPASLRNRTSGNYWRTSKERWRPGT